MITLVFLLLQQVIFVIVIFILLYRLEKFLKDVFLLFKAKDFYEAKEILKPEKEETEEEKYYNLEEIDPEKLLELLNRVENKNQ